MAGFAGRFRGKALSHLRVTASVCCGLQLLLSGWSTKAATPTIHGQPLSQAALSDSNATFVVFAQTPPLTYQWRFNGINVSGATNSAFTVTNVQSANTGAYTVIVSNSSGAITSPPATLWLATPPDFLWARQATNGVAPNYSAVSGARHVAADNSGNVFVAGTFYGAPPPSIDFGGVALTNVLGGSSTAAFVCRYDRFGNLGWARLAATNSSGNWPLRLATDGTGNVYFAGRFSGGATFGTNTLVSSGPADVFLAKYDSQGNALWVRQIVTFDPNSLLTLALTVDTNCNAFISSRYTNAVNIGGIVVSNSSSFLAKYDSGGNLVWAEPCGAAEAIAVGPSGSIYITGSALAASASPGILAKYNPTGIPVWSRQFPHGQSIAVGASEDICATGLGGGTYGDITITNVNGLPVFLSRSAIQRDN